MISKSLQRHIAKARSSEYYSSRDVISIRKALHRWPSDFATPALYDEHSTACVELLEILADNPHRIDPEFTAKGLKWFDGMRKVQTTPQGTPCGRTWRNTALTRRFSDRKRAIVDAFSHFTFEGFEDRAHYVSGHERPNYCPVYRVHGMLPNDLLCADKGATLASFAYCYGSWQNGAGIYFPEEA